MGYLLNMFGEPCAGKSGTAANVFSYLKDRDCDVAYVSEYATRQIREGSAHKLKNQVYISAKQYKLIKDEIDFGTKLVITDSPVLIGTAYIRDDAYRTELHALLLKLHDQFNNINVMVRAAKSYDPTGRVTTAEQCAAIRAHFSSLVDFDYEVLGRRSAGEELAEKILAKYGKEIGRPL